MEFEEYQKLAKRSAAEYDDDLKGIIVAAMGLSGESGEVIDHIKKVYGHKHKLDREYLIKELGDVLWYVSYLSDLLNVSLDEVAHKNILKLKERYPDGFSFKASIERKN